MKVDFDLIVDNLNNGFYPFIGAGSGRRVYDLRNGYVLKVAKNYKGIAQNQTEYEIQKEDTHQIFAEIVGVTSDYRLLVMQKGERIYHFTDLFNYYHVNSINELFREPSIKSIISQYHLLDADLRRLSSWAFIYGRPQIIDYGFTYEVMSRYYRR